MLILARIEYNKKPGKPATITVVKDNAIPKDDMYKSGTIHTGQGEPPNSVSRPTPKGKPKAGKPITSGKLLRPGGPGGGPSKLASRPAASRPVPQARALPGQQKSTPQPRPVPQLPQPAALQSRPVPQPVAAQARPVPQPIAAMNGINHSRTTSASSVNRAPPPPPPGPPPAKQKDLYKALYDFGGQSANELTLQKDEVIEVVQKADNGNLTLLPLIPPSEFNTNSHLGWWLGKKLDGSHQAWTPSAYLVPETPKPTPPPGPPATPSASPHNTLTNGSTTAKAKPAPPAPPQKRPTAGAKKAPLPPPGGPQMRDSAVSMGSSGGGSGRETPSSVDGKAGGVSLAGGLAEALRQRQASMQGRRGEEEGDDW